MIKVNDKYHPPDDRWIRITHGFYILTPDKKTDEEKEKDAEKFKGYKTKMIIKDIMDGIIDAIDNVYLLNPTSESQGHGKSIERDIQGKCYSMTEDEINSYSNTEKYDIKKEHNRINGRNVSIKVSGKMSIDCADIIRFLTSEDMDVICVLYKQVGDIKITEKTIVFKFEDFIEILKKDIEKYCGIDYDEWFKKVSDYDKYVKVLPKEYYPSSKLIPQRDKEHLQKKRPLCNKIPYFNIAPKIATKQQRVQCSVNLNKIKGLNDF